MTNWNELLGRNPQVVDAFQPRWTPYIPYAPYPKQLVFLLLPHREAFFGGAAGGGKSDALLMGALQYVDIPNYHAIIFRKTHTDLALPGALMDRANLWLMDTPARWAGITHTWHFPSGAKLTFGYLTNDLNKFRYQSAEFQFIGFDELTQHYEDDYGFLFSRLRRTQDLKEKGVPLRMRAASNPGGIGHIWVKQRFKIESDNRGHHPERPYIPAKVRDNPALDADEYEQSLRSMTDPVDRKRMMEGDWAVSADGRFKQQWFQYFSTAGDYILMGKDRKGQQWHQNQCSCFVTVDPAASAREGPGDAVIWKRAPSWTVISTWYLTPSKDLLWWNLVRFQKEIPDILSALKYVNSEYEPEFIAIEADGLGIGVYQMAGRIGLPVRSVRSQSQDKLVRATDAINRMEQGKIRFPQTAIWLDTLETELLSWTGHPHEPADQIDTLAHAARIVSQDHHLFTRADLPEVVR